SRHPPSLDASLFPYTTLFRSDAAGDAAAVVRLQQIDLGLHRADLQGADEHLPLTERPQASVGDECLGADVGELVTSLVVLVDAQDRKSTRLNSSHVSISYAVF